MLSTVQRPSDAAARDAQIMLRKEECARSMEQRSNYAAMMGAQIKLNREEYALGMEQQRANNAALMDAIINPNEMDCAEGMGPITTLLTNPLHLIYHIDQHTMKRL